MMRLGHEPVRLSVMFPVYYGFLKKADRFARTRGTSRFSPQDLFAGVLDVAQKTGVVPAEAYEGIKTELTIYDHQPLYAELAAIMRDELARQTWNESNILNRVTAALNHYLKKPPRAFSFQGKEYTPQEFLASVVKLSLDDYLQVTSFTYAPFNTNIVLRVPDNWQHHDNFINVPLRVFYESLRQAVTNGYSVVLDMDDSESSYRLTRKYAFVPSFEVPKVKITQEEREKEFQSGATTDDHLVHIVGYQKFGDEEWYLAKDSGRTAWKEAPKGYFFIHESFIRLKVLAYLVHPNAIPAITKRLPPPS